MRGDLISRRALLKKAEMRGHCLRPLVTAFHMCVDVKDIETAPAVDAVEVVRCKDCEHFADAKGKDSGKPIGYGQCKWSTGIRGIVCADDYCSFGERRTDDAD